MATTSNQAVEMLRDLLNRTSKDVVTLKWDEFYDEIKRERIGKDFLLDLEKKARETSINIAFGNAVVLIAKDYLFAPKKDTK